MKIRIAAVLATATALAAGLAAGVTTALPAYAADHSTTLHNNQFKPWDIAVTSALADPGGALSATAATSKPFVGATNPTAVPAGDLAARWTLYVMPEGSTAWKVCKNSDPGQNFTFSSVTSSTYTLNSSAFKNGAATECGNGIYGLLADGAAFVNGDWHGIQGVYSGPVELRDSKPGPGQVIFSFSANPTSPTAAAAAAAAAAAGNKASSAAASAAAKAGAANAAAKAAAAAADKAKASSTAKNLAVAQAKTAATPPPAPKQIPLSTLPHRSS